MENLDFSNLEYTDFSSIKRLELVEGISTDSPDFFELYYDILKYSGSIGICENCFIKYKDLIDKLLEINLSKIKDISNLFKGAQVIIDDPSDIQRLERGSPLLSNFASNYLNNDSAKIVGDTFDDCTFYIVSKTSTINEITVVDDINISSNVKMLKGMIYLLGRISVVRLPELTIEGVTQVTPVGVKYSDINILNMNKDQDNIIQLSSNGAPIQEIGDSEEVKRHNLSKLTLGHFLTAIDYGFGVGTFSPSTGGFAHITTAYGNDVFYDIAVDGSVTANTTYVKPSAPYTVILEADKIGTTLDAVTANQVQEAGELIVRGSTGLITYTRTSDSTTSAIYFTDDRKDGKTTILTYNVSSRIITSAIVSPTISPATTSTIGGVKRVSPITNLVVESANAEIIAGKVNDLLEGLRSAGIIEP